jgi:hypothetical protein
VVFNLKFQSDSIIKNEKEKDSRYFSIALTAELMNE